MPGLTGVLETKNSADDWEGGGLPVIGGGDPDKKMKITGQKV